MKEPYPYVGGETSVFDYIDSDGLLLYDLRDAEASDRLLILYDYPINAIADNTTGKDGGSESDTDSIDGDWDERDSEYDQDDSENEYEEHGSTGNGDEQGSDGNGGEQDSGGAKQKASTSAGRKRKVQSKPLKNYKYDEKNYDYNSCSEVKPDSKEDLKSLNGSDEEDVEKPLVFHPKDMQKPPLQCGLTFSSRAECKEAIRHWNIRRGRRWRFKKNDKWRIKAVCRTGKDICDWEIFVSNCTGCPVVTTFVPRHKCKFRHKNKSVTSGLAGRGPATSEMQNRCGSCGITGHNRRTCRFIDPEEGVVDLGSNEDDLSDVGIYNIKMFICGVKRKLTISDESNKQSVDLDENIIAEIKAIEAEAKRKIDQLKKKTKTNHHTDVHASKQNVTKQALRRSPRKIVKPESKHASEHKNKGIMQAKGVKKATKTKKRGNQKKDSSFQLIDEPDDDTSQKKETVAQVASVDKTKFEKLFGDVVPPQYKVSYAHKITQLHNVKKANFQLNQTTQLENMKKPDGKIDWTSQSTCDNIVDLTAKAIARTNELIKMCGLGDPSSTMYAQSTISSKKTKPIPAKAVTARTNELHAMYGPHMKQEDIATAKPNMVDFQSLKNPKKVTFFNGTPELEYEEDEFDDLIAPHKMNLVGKFSYGRPKMEILREDFKKIGFKGGYDLGLMNPRRVNSFEEDPPIVPIWVSLHELPLEWTHPTVLYSIASAVGKPLQVDTPTLNLTRPSVAHFCVDVDLMKDLPKSIRIGKKGKKYEQHYTYEHVPSYCPACCKIGHKEVDCRKGKGVIKEDLKTAERIAAEKISTGAKGGLRLQKKKVTWGSKKKGKRDDLQVTIIQENPLIVKGVEKSQPAGNLMPAETHAGESTWGLSALEKRAIPVDIIDSEPLDSGCQKVGDVDGVQKKVIAQGNDGSFDPETREEEVLKKNIIAQGDDGFSLQSPP
ncbi:OLC1v1008616C1 [Oldenlandia corymbosa var. corymbosa]|uniref:OLC1v1008616C1 n=1 Tax=Oldenlandia corymbosa var. corymbosa TaxID=529605 RepID=A0AAV1DPI4_OLDCO|nr:OLC1v1008616C1 [Oldenlandia corymbosa var. corymbosa]